MRVCIYWLRLLFEVGVYFAQSFQLCGYYSRVVSIQRNTVNICEHFGYPVCSPPCYFAPCSILPSSESVHSPMLETLREVNKRVMSLWRGCLGIITTNISGYMHSSLLLLHAPICQSQRDSYPRSSLQYEKLVEELVWIHR